jgi:hypothetical protein
MGNWAEMASTQLLSGQPVLFSSTGVVVCVTQDGVEILELVNPHDSLLSASCSLSRPQTDFPYPVPRQSGSRSPRHIHRQVSFLPFRLQTQ